MFSILLAAQLAAASAPVPVPQDFEAGRILPVTQGGWVYQQTPTGSLARHGVDFLIRCDRTNRLVTLQRVSIVRTGSPPSAIPPLRILTDTAVREIAAGGAALRNTDPLLDAIAYSRGRFIVTGGEGATLVLEAAPEAARSIEDCRN